MGAGDLVLPVDDGCLLGESACALDLLQRNVRKTSRHDVARSALSSAKSAGTALSPTPVPTPESPWPEFEAGGLWDFHVPETPVKIVGWTGMGMVMNEQALETYYPQCTYSEIPHTSKDRSVWHGHAAGPGEYVISDPDTDIIDADVVLFYLPYFMRTNVLPSKKRPGQLWIATCGEALQRPETDMDCSLALDKKFMTNFDGFSGYHGSADFLDPHVKLFPAYQDPPDAEMLRETPPGWTNFGAVGDDLVTLALSDCDSGERNTWIRRIVEQFELRDRSSALVSYGKCFHNREEPGKECKQNIEKWYDPWSNRCSSRSFKLVAENRVEGWYVTEKVWDALWEGSVPIYFGPPEVKYLVPPGSILYYADFESPEALVDHILDFDEAKFTAARSWRNKPESEWGNFTHTRRYGHQTLLPRFCVAGAKARESLAAASTDLADQGDEAEDTGAEEGAVADDEDEEAVEDEGEAAEDDDKAAVSSIERSTMLEKDAGGEEGSTHGDSIERSFEAGFKAGYHAGLDEARGARE